jgi:hypothetical protein
MIDQYDARAALAGDGRAHHAGRTRADDGDVVVVEFSMRQGDPASLSGNRSIA